MRCERDESYVWGIEQWIVYGKPLPPPERGTHASQKWLVCPCPLDPDPAVQAAHYIEAVKAARWSRGVD